MLLLLLVLPFLSTAPLPSSFRAIVGASVDRLSGSTSSDPRPIRARDSFFSTEAMDRLQEKARKLGMLGGGRAMGSLTSETLPSEEASASSSALLPVSPGFRRVEKYELSPGAYFVDIPEFKSQFKIDPEQPFLGKGNAGMAYKGIRLEDGQKVTIKFVEHPDPSPPFEKRGEGQAMEKLDWILNGERDSEEGDSRMVLPGLEHFLSPLLVIETIDISVYIYEFGEGLSLDKILEHQGCPEKKALLETLQAQPLVFLRQLLEGLAVLHDSGLAHFDVKPGNTLVSPPSPGVEEFGVKIIDLGVALPFADPSTRLRYMAGSFAYGDPRVKAAVFSKSPMVLPCLNDLFGAGLSVLMIVNGLVAPPEEQALVAEIARVEDRRTRGVLEELLMGGRFLSAGEALEGLGRYL